MQILCSLCWSNDEKSDEKAYNYLNILVYNKFYQRIETIFMSSGKSKTTGPLKVTLNLSDKINLKKSGKYISLSSFISINKNKKH